jgi:hypothetical protein
MARPATPHKADITTGDTEPNGNGAIARIANISNAETLWRQRVARFASATIDEAVRMGRSGPTAYGPATTRLRSAAALYAATIGSLTVAVISRM